MIKNCNFHWGPLWNISFPCSQLPLRFISNSNLSLFESSNYFKINTSSLFRGPPERKENYVYVCMNMSGMTPVIFFFSKATAKAAKALIWSVKIGTGTSCPLLGACLIWATAECVIFVIVSVNPSQYAVSHLTFPINCKLRVWVMFFIWCIERFMNFCLPPNGPDSTWIYNITQLILLH